MGGEEKESQTAGGRERERERRADRHELVGKIKIIPTNMCACMYYTHARTHAHTHTHTHTHTHMHAQTLDPHFTNTHTSKEGYKRPSTSLGKYADEC